MAAILWGILILAAFVGWGTAVSLVLARDDSVDWGLRAGWGIALTIVVGGALDVLDVVSKDVIVAYVTAGAAAFALHVVGRRRALRRLLAECSVAARRRKLLAVAAAAVAVLALIQLAGSARGKPYDGFTSSIPYFNNGDDFQAYFVYPRQMLQTGSMERDPFNERRLTSSLGGKPFLDAMVLAALPEQSLHLMDPGLGSLIVLGLLLGLVRRMRAPPAGVIGVASLPLLVAPPILNISSVMISVALFLTLTRTLPMTEAWPLARRVALISVTTAALLATKDSVIPATAVLLGLWYASSIRTAPRRALGEAAAIAILVLVLVAPWLIDLHRSSGTFFYPLLGEGDYGTRYGTFYSPFGALTARQVVHELGSTAANVPFVALVLLTVASLRWKLNDGGLARAARFLAVAAIIGSLGVDLLIGFDFYRFSYPFVLPAVISLVALGSVGLPRPVLPLLISTALAAGLLIGGSWESDKAYYKGLLKGAEAAVGSTPPLIPAGERHVYRAMQAAVPAGEPLLTRVERPFLFDFRRNPVYVVDWPGGASPPPGMPTKAGPQALANYLLAHRIRYVAYSYAHEGGFPAAVFAARLQSAAHSFKRVSAVEALAFQRELAALGKIRKHVYDDGSNFVLDLGAG